MSLRRYLSHVLAVSLVSVALPGVAGQADPIPTLDIAAPERIATASSDADGLPHQPLRRVGEARSLRLDTSQGRWRVGEDGTARWELRLRTPDATFVGAVLRQPRLPEPAVVWLVSDQGFGTRGPYRTDSRSANGDFWLPALPGRSAILRIDVPSAKLGSVRLGDVEFHYGTVAVFTGLLTPRGEEVGSRAVGDSGSCQNNVVCPQGDAWRPQIRSAAQVIIGNQVQCSANLLNNSRNNDDPLLITADHCGIGGGRFPAESLLTVFNFQSSQCDSNIGFNRSQTVEGGTLLYRDTLSDTSLVRLPRLPDNADVFLAGWDASGNGAQSGAGIHHPSGDLKKISLFDSPVSEQRVDIVGAELGGSAQTVEAWRMSWADGTTEPGSSGSGLFNENARLIGVLSGGESQCEGSGGLLGGGLLGGGQQQDGPDFYGRLEVAFDRPGALGTPLREFLAPTGGNRVGGRNAGGSASPDATSGSGGGGGGGGTPGPALLALFFLAALVRQVRPLALRI